MRCCDNILITFYYTSLEMKLMFQCEYKVTIPTVTTVQKPVLSSWQHVIILTLIHYINTVTFIRVRLIYCLLYPGIRHLDLMTR